MRRVLLLALLTASAVLAGEPVLEVRRSRVSLDLTLDTSWTSSDHKLRFMDDAAHLEATLDQEPKEGGLVEAVPRALSVTRRKRARISGFLSDDEQDAKGNARWKEGEKDPPPAWRFIVSPQGEAAGVSSAAPLWHLEAFLTAFDRGNDEDARLRRLVHYTDLGFFGAPPLPSGERFEHKVVLELGESGLTNKLVLVEAVFDLTVTKEGDLLRVQGPLARVKLLRGEGPSRSVDQWLDVAFAHGGPEAKGELSAVFSIEKKAWREARSTISLEHKGSFDGGSGRATFTRTLRAAWE